MSDAAGATREARGAAAGVITLAIEASNPSASAVAEDAGVRSGPGVALGRMTAGGAMEVLGVEPIRSGARHDDDLTPAVARLAARVGVRAREIRRVAVSVGPGGYTGLRVACAAGKMIAAASGGVCVAVPTALVVAARVDAARRKRGMAVALAGKGESAYVTVFEPGWRVGAGARAPEGRLMTEVDVAGLGVGVVVADRFLPAAMRSACAACGVEVVEPVFDAGACLEVSVWLAEVDPVELVPRYPREPEAVALWRARRRP